MKQRLRSAATVEPSIKAAYEAGRKFRALSHQGVSLAELRKHHVVRPDGRTREGKAWIRGARGDRLKIVRPRYTKKEALVLSRIGPLGGFLDIT